MNLCDSFNSCNLPAASQGRDRTHNQSSRVAGNCCGAPGSLHGPCLPSTLLLHPSLQKGWLFSEARLSLEDSQTPRRSSPPGVWEAQWQPASWWAFLVRDCSHLHHQELTAPHPALWMCAQGLLQSGWKGTPRKTTGAGLSSSAGCTRL